MTETFGSCLESYRKRERLTIRKAASLMNLSPSRLCDIEKGRRIPPKGESLNRMMDILHLDEEERNHLMNLAGQAKDTVAYDLPEYINSRDYVSMALRTAKEVDAGEEEWLKFIEDLKKRKLKSQS